MYAQVFSADGGTTLAWASTVEGDVRREVGYGGNRDAAAVVGRIIAERALSVGVDRVAFDRSGFRYHGRGKGPGRIREASGIGFLDTHGSIMEQVEV